jgi:hypothetical protein
MRACSGGILRFLHNRPVLRAALVLVLLVSATIASASAFGSSAKFVSFRMPSNNIACGYLTGIGPTVLRCDVLSGLKPRPTARCELDWVGISMSSKRATPTCAGDTVFDRNAPVLRYGSVWKRGIFTCLSARVGLSCANRAGAGFFLSRETWRTG